MPGMKAAKAAPGMKGATPLKPVNGRLVSRKSKTGNPACSQAMSTWVRSRHGGAAATAAVFKVLAMCRKQAAQNKGATAKQASGKLAPGRGTWQRSEKAAGLRAGRAERTKAGEARMGEAVKLAAGHGIGVEIHNGQETARLSGHPHATAKEFAAYYDPRDKKVHFNRDHPAWSDPNAIKEAHRAGWTSTPHDQHFVHHEIGHALHHRAVGDAGMRKAQAAQLTPEQKALAAGRVSHYAATSPNDFLAETHAGMLGGKTFSKEVMDQYAKLGGPKPAERFGLEAQSAKGVKPTKFHDAPGVTKPLLDVRRADLPGQTSMFDRKPRERADALVKPPAATGAHKDEASANRAWDKAKTLQAKGKRDEARISFEHHDAFMRRAYQTIQGKTGAKAATAPASAPANPGTAADFRAILEGSRRSGGARRDKRAQKLARTRSKLAEATRDPSTHTEHAPGTLTHLKTDLIHFDPERFQYKLAAQGSHGVTDALHGVKKWDPELGGVLQVWKDPANGKTFVVNGHHRLDLAKKLGAEKVATRFIEAKNAHEARAKGAITNIAEGRGSSTDAAKFFRDTGLSRADLEGRGVPMREKVATEGLALSNLHDPIFHKVVNGEMTPARGAIIGDGLTHPQQASVLKMLGRLPAARQPTDKVLHAMVSHARHGPVTKQTTHDLFGSNEEDVSLALHRAEADTHIKDRLGREKRVFGTVAKEKNATDLQRGGNVIDAAASGQISDAASQNLATFDLLKHRSGPVSKLLNEAATRIHKGEKKKAVHDEIYGRLPAAVQAALAGG